MRHSASCDSLLYAIAQPEFNLKLVTATEPLNGLSIEQNSFCSEHILWNQRNLYEPPYKEDFICMGSQHVRKRFHCTSMGILMAGHVNTNAGHVNTDAGHMIDDT